MRQLPISISPIRPPQGAPKQAQDPSKLADVTKQLSITDMVRQKAAKDVGNDNSDSDLEIVDEVVPQLQKTVGHI